VSMSDTKKRIFVRDVHVTVEKRDGCTYRTKFVGRVYAEMRNAPFRPGPGAHLVPVTREN
jgi:hypothetical protein